MTSWTSPVPALITEETWARAQRRLKDKQRYKSRNSTESALLRGICVCSGGGYASYRISTRVTIKKILHYRCLGSDDYRYEHGRASAPQPSPSASAETKHLWTTSTGVPAFASDS